MKIRQAKESDLESIIALLENDPLGKLRENNSGLALKSYKQAFKLISEDQNHLPVVIENEGQIVATAQMNFLHYLTYKGGTRAQIEAVRVHSGNRGKGLGETLIKYLTEEAKRKGCHLVQLTADKQRPEALRFYERIGFHATHEGLKMHF